MGDDSGYRLRIESSIRDGSLNVVPVIAAPAGTLLRYEMVSAKEGSTGRSNTRQGGRVSIGESGAAKISTLSLGITPQDRYVVTVKVFDGGRLVAEETLQYPR